MQKGCNDCLVQAAQMIQKITINIAKATEYVPILVSRYVGNSHAKRHAIISGTNWIVLDGDCPFHLVSAVLYHGNDYTLSGHYNTII